MRGWLRSKVTFWAILPSPLTVLVCPAARLDKTQSDHTLTCSDLHSTPTMAFTTLSERGGEKEEGRRADSLKVTKEEKCQQTASEYVRS